MVIFHSTPILNPLHTIPVFGGIIHKVIALTEPFGILGVELFFVLSGFLIGSILIKTYNRSESFGAGEIRSFLVRRWFRTLPNYWLILGINILLYSFMNLRVFSADIWKYFLFVQNLGYRHPDFFPEAWSLAIEEWFYLTLPLVLLAVSSIFSKRSKQNRLLITFILYAGIFFVLRLLLVKNDADPLYFDWGVRKIVLFRLDAISYGFFMAYLYIYHYAALMNRKKALLLAGVAGITLVTGIHYLGIHPHFNFYSKYAGYRYFHNTIMLALIPFFFSLVIPYASCVRELKNKMLSGIITTISKISYSMYLVHFTLIFLPFWQMITYTGYNCIPVYFAYWAIVIGVSLLLYHFFEVPMMNLRKHLSKEEPKI